MMATPLESLSNFGTLANWSNQFERGQNGEESGVDRGHGRNRGVKTRILSSKKKRWGGRTKRAILKHLLTIMVNRG